MSEIIRSMTDEEFENYIFSIKRNYAASILKSFADYIASKEPARNDVNKVNDQAIEEMTSLSWYIGYSACQIDILQQLIDAIRMLEGEGNDGVDRAS